MHCLMQSNVQPSQTAALAFSSSSFSFSRCSFSRFLRLISASFRALSYCFCSSVFFGAFNPSAPAIILFAVDVVFSGLFSPSVRSVDAYRRVGFPPSVTAFESHLRANGSALWGDIGVGGGGPGLSLEVICFKDGPGASTIVSSVAS